MENQNFRAAIEVTQSPAEVFSAVINVKSWWSEEIIGSAAHLNDQFYYHYQDVHRCNIKVIEFVPNHKVVWLVLDNYFSFTVDKTEWTGTKIIFDIKEDRSKTKLQFTHEGLLPQNECYEACSKGWTQYIQRSLFNLITSGKGEPNGKETAYTIHEVAALFDSLAKDEKWFDIQDKLFSDYVISIEPAHSIYFKNAEGKAAVRQKGEDWIKRITGVNKLFTTNSVVGGNHFAVGREVDINVEGHGRVQINQVMLYEVKNGKIISEQFFY